MEFLAMMPKDIFGFLLAFSMAILSVYFWYTELQPFRLHINKFAIPSETTNIVLNIFKYLKYLTNILLGALLITPFLLDMVMTIFVVHTFKMGSSVMGFALGLGLSNIISFFLNSFIKNLPRERN